MGAGIATAVLALVLFLAVPGSAFAWDIAKASSGVVISRSLDDTLTTGIAVDLYWQYLGGDDWTTTKPPNWAASYGAHKSYVFDGSFDGIEIPLVPGYRMQGVFVTQGSTTRAFAVVNDRLAVSLPSTQTVGVSSMPTVAVSSMPSVAVSSMPSSLSTVSILSTVPVNVSGIGDMAAEPIVAVTVLSVLVGGLSFGFVGGRAVRMKRGA